MRFAWRYLLLQLKRLYIIIKVQIIGLKFETGEETESGRIFEDPLRKYLWRDNVSHAIEPYNII